MSLIELKNVSYRFSDGSPGIEDVSLAIEEGEFIVIAGPNGSGKTTLLRHLNGLLIPQKGTVKIAGQPTKRNLLRIRQQVGMVFQDADSQIVGETVSDDVAFGPRNLGLSHDEIDHRVSRCLQAVGLVASAAKRPHLLSGGEKRRLAIAGILAMRPKIIVLDEPFSNLDYIGVRQVLEQILRLHGSGCTIILSTHDIEKVIVHARRLIVMQNGCIARDGQPRQLMGELEILGVRQPCASRLGLEVTSWLN